jgi:predicted DNA repair protein MutK
MKIHEADVVIFQGIFLILVTIYVIFEGLSFLIDYIFPDSEKSDSDAKNKPVEVFPTEKEEIQNDIPTGIVQS